MGFGDFTTSVEFEPTHLFQNTTGGFIVSLIAITDLGCTDTATVAIPYQEGIVYYIQIHLLLMEITLIKNLSLYFSLVMIQIRLI